MFLNYFIFPLLATIPFYFPFLSFLSFFAFYPLFQEKKFKTFFIFGFLFGFFLYLPLLKAIHLMGLNIVTTVFIYLILVAVYSFFQFGLTYVLTRLGLFLPLSFTLVELLRLKFPFDGFPYEYLGKLLVNFPLLKLSLHYLTVFGATFLILNINKFFFEVIHNKALTLKNFLYLFLSLSVMLIASLVYRTTLQTPHFNLKIAVVQPFINQEDKLKNPEFVKLYTSYLLTRVDKTIDLVLLPETAIPTNESLFNFIRAYKELSIIFGTQKVSYDFQKQKWIAYNLVIFSNKGKVEGFYIKKHLVPFGEYTPKGFYFLKKFIPYLGGINYVSTNSQVIFKFKNLKILPIICNEVFYPLFGRKDFDLAVVLANDAWFGISFAKRHLMEVKIRAIETGKVFIFVNNNGYSGVVYPDGTYKGLPFAKIQEFSL